MSTRKLRKVIAGVTLATLTALLGSCADRDLIPMQVQLSRSVTKLPFVIALDQGLYEKYGLDLEVRMEPPEFDGGIYLPSMNPFARVWRKFRELTSDEKRWDPDIEVAGANGRIVRVTTTADAPYLVSVAATDCMVRARVIARKGLERLEDLEGLRLGVSNHDTNSGYVALLLARRMGWDPVRDMSIMARGNNLDALREGRVDAFIATERAYSVAAEQGYPVLEDAASWEAPIAGNSVNVEPEWLKEPGNREALRRFLMAMTEGVALFHQDRELTLNVLAKWHGITDETIAGEVYASGQQIPRKPYPCRDGTVEAMEIYDSNEMRKFSPEDFYDNSLIRELDESGFIDALYPEARADTR
jgi:ABC-type nitrate/sulfonate/bicarbonate transport system substrate-binding protein